MLTKDYYDVCVKHKMVSSCYRNSHFAGDAPKAHASTIPTDEQTGTCSDGYCPCSVEAAAPKKNESTGDTGATTSLARGYASQAHMIVLAFLAFGFAKVAVLSA